MLKTLIHFIAPPECAVCARPGEYICLGCAPSNLVTKVPSCFYCNALTVDGRACRVCQRKSKLRGVHVLWRLDGTVKELIYRLKYGNDRGLADFMAGCALGQFDLSSYDAIAFVPSDGPTLRQRSYNQAELIARSLARKLHRRSLPTLLRTKHTHQVGLSRSKRFEAVTDNFICINPSKLVGKRVLIVDDVLTTGATMSECARILRLAGVKQVWGLAIAKK